MIIGASGQDRINATAAEHGWTGGQDQGAGLAVYAKGTRRVRVYYGVYGQVIDASYQTGSYGGRVVHGQRKADQIIARLADSRWTR